MEFAGITPDFGCTMLVKEVEGGLRIGVSDPTMKIKGEHIITLDGEYTLAEGDASVSVSGGKTTVRVNMTNKAGQTILFTLNKK